MATYDPDLDQQGAAWLAADEDERITAVETYHRLHRIPSPQPRLHASIHAVVETQLAIKEPVVLAALARLRAEGLTRHEAVHAIGMAVAEHMFEIVRGTMEAGADPAQSYLERVRRLTAAQWRQSGEAED